VSADSPGETLLEEERGLRVQAVFRVSDEHQAQSLAAQMVDRAHEIANLPDCECDVDVSVEWIGPDEPERRGQPSHGRPAER
jgi:hypothetical protein